MREITGIFQLIPAVIALLLGWFLGMLTEKVLIRKMSILKNVFGEETALKILSGKLMWLWMFAGIYSASLDLLVEPKYLNIIQKLLTVSTVLVCSAMISEFILALIDLYSQRKTAAGGVVPSLSIFTNMARVLVYSLGILIALQSIGISIAPILTALGVGGLAVALALQDTLSNLFSGLQMIASGQLQPGDYIRLSSGEEGAITDVTWRSTTIKMLNNNLVIIPNSNLSKASVINFHHGDSEMAVPIASSVAYDSDLSQVEAVAIEVAKEVLQEIPGGVADFQPVVRYTEFGDSAIAFNTVLRIKEYSDQALIKHEFIKRLHQRFEREGIEIPFPIRTVYLQNQLEKSTDESK